MPLKPMPVAKTPVTIVSTNHPSAYRKIRCPKCHGYAEGDPHKTGKYNCKPCGVSFVAQNL